jgi:hypothetical protein
MALFYNVFQKGTPPGPTKYIARNFCYTRHKVNDLSLIFFGGYIYIYASLFFGGFRVRLFDKEEWEKQEKKEQ